MAVDTENWDNLSDDDFMNALENASYGPEDETIEDTDQNTEPETTEPEDTEPNDLSDDEDQDNEEPGFEDDGDDFEEHSQAENDSNNESGETQDSGTEAGSEEETGNDSEEDSKSDGDTGSEKAETAEEIDYKKEYAKILEEKAKYEDFYNQVTGEFVANGRKTKGFDDPKKIIQAQQMAAGYTEKMVAFKKYKPFMNTLKEKGILDNPDKFNFAMSLLDGDPEALKKQIKSLEIDPFEMDMDNINYVPKNQIASDIEIALDEVMETASQYGIDDKVQKIISKDWDDRSVIELLEDPQNSADLINHISSGVYDVVQDRIAEKQRIDVNGVYISKPAIEQYREAARELEQEYMEYMQTQNQGNSEPQQTNAEATQEPAEYVNPEQTRQAEEYKAKVEKQNAQTNEARRKATSLSRKKRGTRKPKPQIDPLTLDDDKFTDYLDSLIQG